MSEEYLQCTTENRPYLLGRHVDGGKNILYRPDCKLWTCPHCANVKAKQWQSRMKGEMKLNTEFGWYFVTLTIKGATGDLERQVEIFRSAWDKFSKRLKRVVKRDLAYMLIPELSPEKKRLHAHMVINYDFGATIAKRSKKLKSAWLHDNLPACGFGYIYDIQRLEKIEYAAHYVTKYIGKGLSEVFPQGFRRVRTSQGFFELPETTSKDDFLWEVILANASGRGRLLLAYLSGEIIWDTESCAPLTLSHPLLDNKS